MARGTWRALLGRAKREGRFLGVDARRYPRDFATFVRFGRALAQLGPRYDLPPPMPLAFFESALREHGAKHGIVAHDCSA
ncbi:hypothetical protein [Caballeronia ptereochthonis]|uniref:hypothetical protein n=1 Tax=Caballeronia ptereochthonis TaxID=1777144 RepID=UPI001ABF637D|nr:hypothetical protein [Caballeronia ptereochthonis]